MGKTPEEYEESKRRVLEDAIDCARKNGAQVYRYVLLINGYTFTGEAMFRNKFIEQWEDMNNRPELARAEYGVRPKDGPMFAYVWTTL